MGCSGTKIPRDKKDLITISKKDLAEIVKHEVEIAIKGMSLERNHKKIDKMVSTIDLKKRSTKLPSPSISQPIPQKPINSRCKIPPGTMTLSKEVSISKIKDIGDSLESKTISEIEEDFKSLNSEKVAANFRFCDRSHTEKRMKDYLPVIGKSDHVIEHYSGLSSPMHSSFSSTNNQPISPQNSLKLEESFPSEEAKKGSAKSRKGKNKIQKLDLKLKTRIGLRSQNTPYKFGRRPRYI